SRLEIEGEGAEAKIYHIVGGQLNTTKMTKAEFEALTPLMVYETTVSGWHQYKSNTTGAELTTTVSVDADGNALIKTDITSLPNDKYNIKVNLDNTVTQYADTKMDVVIDTSANPVIFGGHEYVCYADSSKSGKADIYGNCGLIITTHISYTAGEPFGDVTPWSDPNATPSTYYEMYPNATNTPNLEVTGNNAYKMNSGKVSTYNITGLPAGEYEVYVKAKSSNANTVGFSVGAELDDNGAADGGNPVPGRYWVQAGEGEKVYTETGDKLYSAVGVGSSSMEWTTEAVVKSVMIAEGTTSFKFGHTKAGYSISYDAIRLVKIGSYMATNNIVFDENNAAKVEGEAYSLKHTIFTNTGEETDYTANYSYNEVTYPTNLDGSVEDDEGASGGQYLHGLYRQGWNQSKGSNMSGEVVYRIKLSEEAKVKIKARIKSNMETEKVCLDLKVDGANKGTFRSANTWVEVESTEMTLAAGVHTISFVGQQLSGSENYTSVLGDLDWFELDKIPVPKATLKGNYQGAPADTVVKATDDGKVPELPAATRAGDYKFLGWFTEEEGGTKVEAGADITADMNLYAHWLEYTWTEGTKVADVTPASSAYGDVKYTMLKADADGDNDTSKKLGKATAVYETYDITGAIPAGTYDIEILGRNSTGGSSFNLNEKYAVYNGAMEDANKITLDAGTYKSFGFNESSNAWTTKCGSITIAEGATSISIAYLGGGNSAYIDGIRLVVRTANTTPAA
ncbi:MAG: InlB B-repeat-containing protein, partial [Bacilli bacterium]|nr:InlB B-repeat-containing protein [Bacilli bacterium]